MDRKRYGCFPSPLHKEHPRASCNLLKEVSCLSTLAWAEELQGVFPQCPAPGTSPSPFVHWLWGAITFIPALTASHIPSWSLQSVGLLSSAGDKTEAGR